MRGTVHQRRKENKRRIEEKDKHSLRKKIEGSDGHF